MGRVEEVGLQGSLELRYACKDGVESHFTQMACKSWTIGWERAETNGCHTKTI